MTKPNGSCEMPNGSPAPVGSRPGVFQIPLRDEAKAAPGDKFSFKEYHNAVLEISTLPLPMLDREVTAYIQSKR